jgi:multidrug resistance efflux pump
MLKKRIAWLAALCVALSLSAAQAEPSAATLSYSGTVAVREVQTVLAPFGGRLADFSLRPGDAVASGETLFTLSVSTVYAPFAGNVRGLRAQPGDDAAQVGDRYGALCYLEPQGLYTVSASTSGAYDSTSLHNRNRYVNQGDVVYLESDEDDARTGTGIVTAVDGRSFTVEVTQSTLDPEDTVTIYNDPAMETADRIARSARLSHAQAVAVTAQGSVLRCLVGEGQAVQRGDPLFETVSGTFDSLVPTGDTVLAPADGVVQSGEATAGATVNQFDVLATLYRQSDLWVTFDADESDLDTIAQGSPVTVTLDALPGRAALAGTVEAISAVNDASAAGVRYAVYVSLADTDGLRAGMSVSVTLP